MAKYTSPATVINKPAAELVARFADFTAMQTALDALGSQERAKVGDVAFTRDTIKITTPQVGDIVLRATERTPDRIKLEAENSPVPMSLTVDFKAINEAATEVIGAIDVDIPMMLKPMVGPALQKAADQFGTLFARLA